MSEKREFPMLVKTEKYNRSATKRPNIIIKVYEEEPEVPMPQTEEEWHEHFMSHDGSHIQGKYSYAVYREGEEDPFYSDGHDIWDVEGALGLAYQDFSDEWECDELVEYIPPLEGERP